MTEVDCDLWLWWGQGIGGWLRAVGLGDLRSRGLLVTAEAIKVMPKFDPTVSHLYRGVQPGGRLTFPE